MSTQVHMRHRDGELNSAYAHIDSFVNEDDVKIHANGSCCPCAKKEPEKPVSDYNLDMNKPKINGHTLIGDMTGEELGLLSGQNAYEELTKVKDYLYEAYYKTLDYQYALDYFINTKISLPQNGCTTIRKGNYYGRNYDWTYDRNVEFIVKTSHINDRYAVMGVAASIVGLTQDTVDEGKYNELYKIVPFRLVDGINEKGVIINTNVVPTDKGINDITVPAVKEEVSICSVMLPRFVLDHFATAREAAEYLRDYASIYAPKTLEAMGYEAHWIIADENETYLIEIIDKQVIITNMSENGESHLANRPYMTNFYLSDITLNDNGKVYTPEYRDGDRNAISYNHITPYGCGLERYNYIVDNYNNITNKEDLRSLLSALKYTNAYRLSTTPAWNTEFVGLHDLTVVSNPEEYRPVLENAAEIFATRTRDEGTKYSGTWQTTHSSIYDIVDKKLYIVVQEDNEELKFEYSELTPIDPTNYPELRNKPQINGVELLGNKTSEDLHIEIPVWKEGNGLNSVQQKDTTSIAEGDYSVAEGYNTLARSDYSHAEGWASRTIIDTTDTETYGHASHAEGSHTIAKGAASHAEGNTTESNGWYSHAEGAGSLAGGLASHAEGNGTVTNNVAEHAEGSYNKSNENTLHSIGMGTSMTDRKNAFEVMQNGDAYLIGIGDYNGANPEESNTIKEVIDNKQDKLTAGTNITIIDNVISATSDGLVNSVNGKTGIVVLTADDIKVLNNQSIQYNLERIDDELGRLENDKQNKLTAGANITIDENNVISSTGGNATWGYISGTLDNQTDLKNVLDNKADSTKLVGTQENPVDLNNLTEVGVYQLSGVLQNAPEIIQYFENVELNLIVTSKFNEDGTTLIDQKIDLGDSIIIRQLSEIEEEIIPGQWILKDLLTGEQLIQDTGINILYDEDNNQYKFSVDTTVIANKTYVDDKIGNIETLLETLTTGGGAN